MIQRPLVSVVIPTFNRAGIICRTIDNLFEQTYKNFEVIIVDDGSTDDTPSILRSRYGDRIRTITQTHAGPAVARNHGVNVARGEIIAFQDSDDLWKPTKLDRQVALLAKTDDSVPCCLCNADMGFIKGEIRTSFDYSSLSPAHGEGLWVNVMEVLATRFVLFNQTVALRREAFQKIGGFDETLKYLEDYDLPLRLALEGDWALIREPLVVYCGASPGSFSQQALKDPLTLKQCEVAIFERISARVDCDDRYAVAQKCLRRRLKIFRRGMTEIRLAEKTFCGARSVGRALSAISHYQEALFRRSPWFPKMITRPIMPPVHQASNPRNDPSGIRERQGVQP